MLKPLVTVSESLFSELVTAGPQARAPAVLVTPNERLAREYRLALERAMSRSDQAVFRSPRVLSLRTWLDSEYAALRAERPTLPRVLAESTVTLLARRAADEANLDAPDRIVRDMLDAWQTALAYGLDLERLTYPRSDAFSQWLARFTALIAPLERLPKALVPATLAAEAWLPSSRVITIGLEELTLAERDYCEFLIDEQALQMRTIDLPGELPGHARRSATNSFREELAAACAWARSIKLREAEARIGIVVPSLAARHAEVAAVCGYWLDRERGANSPTFDIAGGERLSEQAVWAHARQLLAGLFGELDREAFDALCRSVFLPGLAALSKRPQRGSTQPRHLKIDDVLRHAPLEGIRDTLAAVRGRHPLTDWWPRLQRVLWALGWPGGSALNSRQYQAHLRIAEVLESVHLDWEVSGREALKLLDQTLAEIPFAPERTKADVFVLGTLETTGLEFTHLWITEMSDVVFPATVNRNPFIGAAVAARAGLPRSTPDLELIFSERLLRHWSRASEELRFSYARFDAETEFDPSRLITNVESVELDVLEPFAGLATGIALETYIDDAGPAITGRVSGGSRLLTSQAQCPFKAFAENRLDLKSPEHLEDFLSPLDRGIVLHALLAELHQRFPTQDALQGVDTTTLESMADQALAQVARPLPGRFLAHERARLVPLLKAWRALELSREPFRTRSTEARFEVDIGRLTITIRIDRIDEVGTGLCVMDYKTGSTSLKTLDADPLEDAQLPLYAQVDESVRAAFYVELRPGSGAGTDAASAHTRLVGIGDGILDRHLKADADWEKRKQTWHDQLEKLAADFAAGHAAVDPVAGACEYCHLKPVCRIND